MFKRRAVEIGAEQGGLVQIRSGLKPDESIVARGAIFVDNEVAAMTNGEHGCDRCCVVCLHSVCRGVRWCMIAFAAFLGLGYVAFLQLNIEAYPDPAPPIIEIIAQRARPIARGNGALRHDSDRDRAGQHSRAAVHPFEHGLWR